MTPMIVEHPLLQHKLSILRNKQTGTKEFRDLVGEIATLLCYEATRDLPLEEVEIETPITMAKTKVLAGRKLALVPILRAGLGMVDGMLARIEEELGTPVKLIVTGGISELLVPQIRHELVHRPNLLVQGLYSLYKRNTRSER